MCDSGIGWLGEIPADWKVRKIKYLFDIHKRIAGKEGYDVLSVTQKGLRVKDIESGEGQLADDYSGYQLVYPGDFVMNHMDLLTGWVDCSDLHGVTSPDYRVFRPKSNMALDSRFYRFVFQYCYSGRVFFNLGNGVSGQGRWRLQTSAFNNFIVPFPPLSGQRRIADYLDEQCAAIDETKKTIEDEVGALRRLRAATIFKAVTKGLDDGAPMRDSGVEWIGEIPTTWEMVPNHAVFSESREIVGNRSDRYVLLSLTKQGVIKRDMDGGGKFPSSFDSYQVVRAGQMIFCLFDIDETPRTVGLSTLEGMITGAYDVFDVNERVCDSRYALYYYLIVDEGKHLRPYYRSLRKTLTTTAFRHVKMPLPPIDEQRRIADYLDERCAAIDSVIDARARQLDRLEDYRKALIYAYATGKKEVPASWETPARRASWGSSVT